MKKIRNQRGVALLFALGMLTILLVTGMAFVANALTAQKVAANNSARTQARMFAQSAVSRMLTSIMMYQYRIFNDSSDSTFPEKFDNVRSKSEINDNDGLTGADSLLKLPEDDSVIDSRIAKSFNTRFSSSWDGNWVYFYDNVDKGQIIGRAAWQVLSTSPQILAPVFFSGHLETDGTPDWKPSKHRWGREIDEVFLENCPTLGKAKNLISKPEDSAIRNLDLFVQKLTGGFESVNWFARWFMPDISGKSALEPTQVIPEVYSAMDGSKKRQYLRFNISEIFKDDLTKYGNGITTDSDPWYARFGINSTKTNVSGNNENALKVFTADSPMAAMGDSFDYDLKANPDNLSDHDRPSLPFLRRIGNFGVDKPTFANIESWRKQIAANFNDYCDADSIPTSDKVATAWKDLGADEHPTFTGNEKTPYLYELGFRLGLHPASDGGNAADTKKNALSLKSGNATDSGGTYSVEIADTYVSLAPIVKLTNIYDFVPTDYSNFSAEVELGSFKLKIKPKRVTLKVNYIDKDSNPRHYDYEKVDVKTEDYDLEFSEIEAEVDFIADNTAANNTKRSLKVEDEDEDDKLSTKLGNSDGKNPYPLLVPGDSIKTEETAKLKFNVADDKHKVTFKGSRDLFNKITPNTIPADSTIDSVALVSIDEFEVSYVNLKVNRAWLKADIKPTADVGLDYVRPLTGEWTKGSEDTAITASSDGKNGWYIGGIRNFDPRQNLNPGDWTTKLQVCKSENILKPVEDAALENVMKVGVKSGDVSNTNQLKGIANTHDDESEKNKFLANEGDNKDIEVSSEPGYDGNGTEDDKWLSTAFIRNAPMMSPWEIGFIHRGIRWQTLNIKSACDPDNNNKAITLAGHSPVSGWSNSGTSYEGGDGGILDQIKMTDQCATYGKINVNKLRTDDPEYDDEKDKEIIQALFDGLLYDQQIKNLYGNSTRNSGGDFPSSDDNGTTLNCVGNTANTIRNNMVKSDSRPQHTSRAHFLHWAKDSYGTAFGGITEGEGETDVAQEEIVGKTINLLCAENVAPTQIYAVIVAQSIRDVGGTQYRKVTDPDVYSGGGVNTDAATGSIHKNCSFGQFDFAESSNGYKDNIYFDEITGEVKMFVTIDRDINTGRMTVRRIDYLE